MTRHVELIRLGCVLQGVLSLQGVERSSAALVKEQSKGEGKRRRQRGLKSAKAFDNFDLRWAPCERDREVHG
jgi:hypothetical protein